MLERASNPAAEGADGGDVRCVGCGACCMLVGRPPFPGYERDRDGQPCTEFDLVTKRCRIYASRPEACRAFEVGGVSCQAVRIKVGVN